MTYEELVERVRETYEYADARDIFEHIAVQVNVLGEAAGAFYVEVANRQVCVEPYDYYDRDGLITVETNVVLQILDGSLKVEEAVRTGAMRYDGNQDKLKMMFRIKVTGKK